MEEATDEWAGVSGQISTVRDEVSTVTREVARVEQKVDAMAAEIKAEMAANQELIMEQLRSMAQQKADPYLY